MKKKIIIPFLFFLFFQINAQTSGLDNVVSIETKANLIETNKKKITENKQKLPELEKSWKDKIQKLKDQLLALQKERDNLIADMKVGARCSQCGKWKSEFEKEGVNFQQHLGDVKGYAIPATTSELESIRKQYGEKMAIVKVQIQRLEKGDDAVLANINETDKLFEKNKTLCEEMTKLSKDYETTVLKESENKHEEITRKLGDLASDFLIANDWITIQTNRILQNQKYFRLQSDKIKQQLETENKELTEFKNNEILKNEETIKKLQIKKDSISTTNNTTTNIENEIENLKNLNRSLALEISNLDSGLSQKIQQSILETKSVFDKNEMNAKGLIEKEKNNATLAKKRFEEEINTSSKLNNAFVSIITEETNRMVIAGKKVDCPIWNGTSGEVASNWNQLLPCIRNLVSSNLINPYCSKWNLKNYLGKYLSFISSLDEKDLENIQSKFIK